jgi:hypothetical protein
VQVACFGQLKASGVRQFLELPNGMPFHDTFNDVFACLDAEAFCRCFSNWASHVRVFLAHLLGRSKNRYAKCFTMPP